MDNNIFDDKIILVFPSVGWNHNWERQHELIYRFSKCINGKVYIFPSIGYINHGLGALSQKLKNRLKPNEKNFESKNPTTSNMKFVRIPWLIPYHNVNSVRAINKLLMKKVLKRNGVTNKNSDRVIVLSAYSTDTILDIIDYLKPKLVITDIAQRRKANSEIPQYAIRFEEELVRKSDVIFADSRATCEDYKEVAEINYFCQGVSLERNNIKPQPVEEMEKLEGPIVGYIGALHSSIDYELVEFVIKNNPNYNFVFVGNIIVSSAERLKTYPNVLFVGRKSYEELNNYIQYFHVGIIPYLVNSYTDGVSPTKLFEYGIQGIPVVSTYLREVVQFSDAVYLAENKEEFSSQLRNVIEIDSRNLELAKQKIYNLSISNSWESKFNFFYSKVVDAINLKDSQKL
ncbi:glycosyltransferase [Clostridium tunisiense]|uniref:glycosyltransferase n=1 Tax=Clostridium tunisiense TaxID=219748 RepID=UPI0002E5FCA3|nr:glycosyltransferase [Clostridium tunisiense]